jgi:membrane protein implicated in regulation of membrane protease activity
VNVVNFFADLGPVWNWLLLGALLLGLEIIVPGVHFIWFDFRRRIIAVLVFITGMPWGWQLAFAFVASAFVYFCVATPARSGSRATAGAQRPRPQQVGRTVVVAEALSGGRGRWVGDTI